MAIIKHSTRTVRKPCRTCGTTDLYWSHDSDGPVKPNANHCGEHDSSQWTLINRDGSKHLHGLEHANEPGPDASESASDLPAVVMPAASPVTVEPDRAAIIGALLDQLNPKVDAAQVHAIVDARLAGLVLPLTVHVETSGVVKPLEGFAHKVLPTVIAILGIGKHVMMVGPAGTGKSHIASQAAEALGLESYSISLSPQTPTSAILGYMTATGDYVPSLFRQAYEHGGVFHFDEVDNSHPSVLAVINAALANGSMAFPDGMVKRGADFRCIASANTYGNGPDRAYVGRQAMDMATKDRFEIIDVPVDNALEEALCMGTGLDAGRVKSVLAYVRHLRNAAEKHKLPLSFSPRRSHGACSLLAAGLTARQVTEISIRRGISDTDWNKVADGSPGL